MNVVKKIFFIVLLLGFTNHVLGQPVRFKCYIKTDCTNTIVPFRDYLLSRNGKFYHPDETFFCSLPDTGTYTFTMTSEAKVSISVGELKISTNVIGNNTDTFYTNDLTKVLILHSSDRNANKYDNWRHCGAIANGFIVDSTNTGRMEGRFKNGRAIGAINSYNRRGELIVIEHYSKRGKLFRSERLPAFYRHDDG